MHLPLLVTPEFDYLMLESAYLILELFLLKSEANLYMLLYNGLDR